MVKGVVYIVSRFVKVIALILIGAIAISLLALLLVGHMGLPYVSIFSPDPNISGYIGYYAGIIALMIIPLIAVIRWGLRLHSGYRSNYRFRKSVFGIWIVTFMIFLCSVFFTARHYDVQNAVEDGTIINQASTGEVLQINLHAPKKYRNIRTIHLGDSYLVDRTFHNQHAVKVTFYPTDSDSIQIRKTRYSRGISSNNAKRQARAIQHDIQLENNTISLNQNINFDHRNKYRGQQVQYDVYLPIGTKVQLNKGSDVYQHRAMRWRSADDHLWEMTDIGIKKAEMHAG